MTMEIDGNNYLVQQNSFLISAPSTIVHFRKFSKDFKMKLLFFEKNFLLKNISNPFIIEKSGLFQQGSYSLLNAPAKDIEHILTLLDYLKHKTKTHGNFIDEIIRSIIFNILLEVAEITHRYANEPESKDQVISTIYLKFRKLVQEQILEHKTVQLYADQLHISNKYLIEIVKKTLVKFGSPVYVRHEIVHNTQVVENLKKLGAIFVEELDEIKDRSRPVIFSAHGVPKSVPEDASNKKMFYIDATCPLVTKVHREAERHNKNGYKIILIGHKGHPEVIGTMGQIPKENIVLVETIEDAKSVKITEPVAYVTQTTLSVDDTKEIIKILEKKFPKIKAPVKEDICYATTNRQNAVKQIASSCDMFFVIGSDNSSNSKRLVEVAKKAGCGKSYLINFKNELPIKEIVECNKIGLTSGASAPEKLVQSFISEIKKHTEISIEENISSKESVTFKLPSSLTS